MVGEVRPFPAPQAPKLCLGSFATRDQTQVCHPNTQVPGNQGRCPLRLREWEAHEVLEDPALWFLGFLLRGHMGGLTLGRSEGEKNPEL